MARKVQVILSDDLDENLSADETAFEVRAILQETGLPAKKSRDWFVVGLWLAIAAVAGGAVYLLS